MYSPEGVNNTLLFQDFATEVVPKWEQWTEHTFHGQGRE